MNKLTLSTIAVCGIALAATMPAVSARQQAPYSGIVVFGTSLSDPGNAFALRGGTSTPPDYGLNPLLIPDAPYARGGHHFSNGATWVEQFARSLALSGSVRPAFASDSPGATNYAVGGARACDAPTSDGINLADQVNAYLTDAGNVARPDALYVIEMGGNDLRDAIAAALGVLQGGGTFPQAFQAAAPALQCAQQAIAAAIQALTQAGATRVVVWTVPDLGLTPAIRSLGPGPRQVATLLTTQFNQAMLLPTVHALDQASTDLRITVLDAFSLLQQLNAAGANFGLTNTTTACVTPSVAPYFCQQADDYLFWDGIHPTRAVHSIIADRIAMLLAAQP